jgi:hypothetical protein
MLSLGMALSVGKTVGVIGGIGWLLDKIVTYRAWMAKKAKDLYALAKLKAGGPKTSEPETLTKEGAGEEGSSDEGNPPPKREPVTNHKEAETILANAGFSKQELHFIGQTATSMFKAA